MSETVIVAIITAIAAVVGSYLANRKSIIEMGVKISNIERETEKQSQELEVIKLSTTEHGMELKSLTEQVHKHNNVIERTYKLEKDNEVQNSELAFLKEKVSKL